MKILRIAAVWVLGIFFIYSGAIKASSSDAFAMSIAQYLILPSWSWKFAAVAISVTEFCAGVLLLIPRTRRLGAVLILLLMGIFLFALGTALARGLDIECGCLPGLTGRGPTALWIAFWKDIGISVVAALLAWFPRPKS